MLHAEGLDQVFARHDRAAKATRTAVLHWGFDVQRRNEAEYSSSLTAVRLPDGHSADALRREVLVRANMSLGNGLGPLADRVFRIGHLGDFNNLTVAGTLSRRDGPESQGRPISPGRGRGRDERPWRQPPACCSGCRIGVRTTSSG